MSEIVEDISQSNKPKHGSHEKLESVFNSRRKTLAEEEIQWSIFQGDFVTPIQFVTAMMQRSYIFRKCIRSYIFKKSKENIKHFMKVDNFKILAKNE